jgi:hypothetical protein
VEKGFIKKIIKASEELDTSIYLNSATFEEAIVQWLEDFADGLNSVTHLFEKISFKTTGATFLEKRLEQIHKEYLDRVVQYVEGVDLVFSRKALQYAKIAVKLNGPKLPSLATLENIKEAKNYLKDLKLAIEKINNFSSKLLAFAKENKLISLPKYNYQFKRLTIFEK